MKRAAFGLAMGLAFGVASAQQVWRCELDGQVRYTDQPCGKSGRPLPASQLKANVADGIAAEAVQAQAPASAASGISQAADAPASAASDAGNIAAAATAPQAPTASGRRGHRVRFAQVAMRGLMDTDFVQRGYVPRRQNPTSTPNP